MNWSSTTTVVSALTASLVLAALYLASPYESGLFPPCPTRVLLGFECPGCGAQRALHDLLHGRVAQAWAINPFVLLVLPYAAVGLLVERAARRSAWAARLRRRCYGRMAAVASAGVLIGWTVWRNWA